MTATLFSSPAYPLVPVQGREEVVLSDGQRFVIDFGWPTLLKGVEVDGLDAHSGPAQLENDLRRQNALLDAGIELRRFSAREVRRDPKGVAVAIARFLL